MADSCLSTDQLERYATDALAGPTDEAVAEHLSNCPACRDRLADVQANLHLEGQFRAVGLDGRGSATTVEPVSAPSAAVPQERIGPYRLLRKLGEGGFGIVYLAEQCAPVHRRVAVKVIKPGMDSAQVVARFEAERQALAVMEHACIAKVLDGGVTERGLPFFVMEHVQGEPITAFCDRQCLGLEDRVRLFVRVCEAVQHAHTKGIIHRDLKPSNILVAFDGDGRPQPKVIDFGVIKALGQRLSEHTVCTGLGQVVGTPAYMSPEQAETSGLDIDTRSDVYALGVLLYELLTGALPYEATARSASRLDQEPLKPSTRLAALASRPAGQASGIARSRKADPRTLQRRVRGDLDWIVMKCLERDRTRRYDTAHAVALELRRFLDHQPVEAGPPSVAYLIQKFAQRHRTLVRAGITVAAVLVLATAGMGVLSGWALRERANAQLAEHRSAQQAESLAVVIDAFVGAFRSQDVGWIGELTPKKLMQAIDRQTATTLQNQPAHHAAVLQALGRSYQGLTEFDQAEEKLRAAHTLLVGELGANSPEALLCRYHLASVLASRNELEEAETLLRDVLANQTAQIGGRHADTLATRNLLGQVLLSRGQPAEAEEAFRTACRDAQETLGPFARVTLQYHSHLAQALGREGRAEEEASIFEDVLAKSRAHLGPLHPDTRIYLNSWAGVLFERGEYEEAERILRELLAANREVYGDRHLRVAAVLGNLALVLEARGDLAAAESALREGLATLEDIYGPEHRYTKKFERDLAQLLERRPAEEAVTPSPAGPGPPEAPPADAPTASPPLPQEPA